MFRNKEMQGSRSLVERWRYRLLLGLLLATILIQPLLQGPTAARALLILVYGAILFGGVHATRPSRGLSALCLALAIALVGLRWVSIYSGPGGVSVPLIIVTVLFGSFVVSRTLSALLSEPNADADALAGAVFGYFLLVVVWALVFLALETWTPGSFRLPVDRDAFTELLYFSLVTITTLGYGDISPVAPFARISAGLEAATGTFYVAILIARIVGALGGRRG